VILKERERNSKILSCVFSLWWGMVLGREGGLPLHCWDLRVLVISKNLLYSCGNCWDRKIFLKFLLHND